MLVLSIPPPIRDLEFTSGSRGLYVMGPLVGYWVLTVEILLSLRTMNALEEAL